MNITFEVGMKNIILTLVALLALSNYANAAVGNVVISGQLLDDINLEGRINKLIFTENKEEVRLINEYVEAENCSHGQFELEEVEADVYKLKRVLKCEEWFDPTVEVKGCPENFQPICGEVGNEFGKALPEIRTFSNTCEMYRARASFVSKGSCQK